jgi:soluble lytic murein transglycosylase
MALRLSGRESRRHPSLSLRLLAGAAIAALLLPLAGEALAAAKPKAKPKLATTQTVPVPLPRLRPATSASASTRPAPKDDSDADAIGALIAQAAPDEAGAREDSDAPEAAAPRADLREPPPTMPPPKGGAPIDAVGLRLAVKLLENNDPGAATLAAFALPDKVDIKIVNWLIATGGYAGVSSAAIADLQKKLADWPGQSLMRLRYEQALVREDPPPQTVIAAFPSGRPASDDGKVLLAKAYVAVGRRDDAAKLIRAFWRDENFSQSTENSLLKSLAGLLRPADHKARLDRLLYTEHTNEALRTAALLDKNQVALAKAVQLAVKGSSKAGKALDALPASVKRDTVYLYARIEGARRSGKISDAARLLASAPRDAATIVSPDTWWVERRLVSRALIEQGDAKLAYSMPSSTPAGMRWNTSTIRAWRVATSPPLPRCPRCRSACRVRSIGWGAPRRQPETTRRRRCSTPMRPSSARRSTGSWPPPASAAGRSPLHRLPPPARRRRRPSPTGNW